MNFTIGLGNFKGAFARIWFNIAMTSDRLSFASVEIPLRVFLPTTKNKASEREPGNEAVKT